MKVDQTSPVEYDEVDRHWRMKLSVLFRRLQRAAIHHSEVAGLGPQAMAAAGGVWLLNRMRVVLFRLPRYREPLTVRTWHQGSAGFRADRGFRLWCDGEPVAAACSQWFYFDLNRQRVAKVPDHLSKPYGIEREPVPEAGAIAFAVDRRLEGERTLAVCTRAGDFDSNGHVNNTVYLEYLETLIQHAGFGPLHQGQVAIAYLKEIGSQVSTVGAGILPTAAGAQFRFFNDATVYAAGFLTFSR